MSVQRIPFLYIYASICTATKSFKNVRTTTKCSCPSLTVKQTLIMLRPRPSKWRLLLSLYKNKKTNMLMPRFCLPLPRSPVPSLHLLLHKGILCYASLYKAERQEMTAKSGGR